MVVVVKHTHMHTRTHTPGEEWHEGWVDRSQNQHVRLLPCSSTADASNVPTTTLNLLSSAAIIAKLLWAQIAKIRQHL
jgi:hypothetical protein